jgi:cyanophycinase
MPGEIILAGGEEFRPGCEEMDRLILEATGAESPRVVIVPTAAVTGPQKAAADGVRHFSHLGANASELMVLRQEQANDEGLIKALSGVSVVYFTGGNPEHLLATLQGSKLLETLREEVGKGAILGGSSAGAMVMGAMMWGRMSRRWLQGLGFAEEAVILPHHEGGDPNTVVKWLESTELPPGLKALGVDARTCCFGTRGSWKALGPGKVTAYQNGSWTVHSSGETLPQEF